MPRKVTTSARNHAVSSILFALVSFFGLSAFAAEPLPEPPRAPLASPQNREASPPAESPADPAESQEPARDQPVEKPQPGDVKVFDGTPEPVVAPPKVRRLYRIGALGLAAFATVSATAGIALGMDVALFGQEFHNQARTFSLLNALLGTVAAASMVWPLGLALDGNGDFWWTSGTALVAGGAAIGVMYAWAHGDPDRLLAQSFTPGVLAFVSAIVVYEMTSDTSRRYREATGDGDAWFSVAPIDGGAMIGLGGRW
jgi:hypothetical protein